MPRTSSILASAASALVVLQLVLGCASKDRPLLEQPVGATHDPVVVTETPRTSGKASGPVPEVFASRALPAVDVACSLPDDPADAPRFDFDSAELRPRGRYILDHLARCLNEGPLRDYGVWITGHTDPRGNAGYNHLLGLMRADAARQYLLQQGVQPGRIGIRSRGERGADGTDPVGYAFDRFVDFEAVALEEGAP